MKNPMDRQLEKRLSDRAVAIGREGETSAFGELLTLLKSSSANARRLAASALGKLAWMGADQSAAVAAEHHCQRCNALVTADEFARSQQAFQRIFCDRCFDEVFLERRNFETQVEINKTSEAQSVENKEAV
jgi:hypothetical protein